MSDKLSRISALALAAALLTLPACKDRNQSDRSPVQMPPILASATAAPAAMKETSMFTPLTDDVQVSPQISLDQVAAAKAEGVTVIINNRPDGEDPSAPQSAEIEAAARAAGIEYVSIPVTHAGFSAPQVDAMIAALDKAEASGGKVLAYCRSGTRSTHLWALARARAGDDVDGIVDAAAKAGYDLTGLRPMMDALSGEQ